MRACTLLEQAGGYVIQSTPCAFDAFGGTARRPRDPAGRVSRGGEESAPPPPSPCTSPLFIRFVIFPSRHLSFPLARCGNCGSKAEGVRAGPPRPLQKILDTYLKHLFLDTTTTETFLRPRYQSLQVKIRRTAHTTQLQAAALGCVARDLGKAASPKSFLGAPPAPPRHGGVPGTPRLLYLLSS